MLPPIPKPYYLPIIKNIDLIKTNKNFVENKDLIKNNDSIYKDYHENKYILPLIVGGSIGIIIYFVN